MNISVIISTYNQPDWLELTLQAYAVQTRRDFQILIADDGSNEETRRRIDALRPAFGTQIMHVWQEDDGFRKCEILNKAIVQAQGDYLIFTDGDCIPRRDFVSRHAELARPNTLLSGGYLKLSKTTSDQITSGDVLEGRASDARTLWRYGCRSPRILTRLAQGTVAARWSDRLTTTRPTFNGCNTSVWKKDVVAVNGFNERMGYGGEDRELGERLVHYGVRSLQVRYRAICVHLDHPRAYRTPEAMAANREVRDDTQQSKSDWTSHGIFESREAARKSLTKTM
jgi:glycosyltransferase involved in cell wall biosynthesis